MNARRITTALFGVALAACICNAACGATWFTDNFDAYSNGFLSGNGGWLGDTQPVRVATDFDGGDKCVKMSCKQWGGGSAYHTVTSGVGFHYIDFDAAMNTAGSAPMGTNLGYIKFFDASGAEITRFYFAKNQFRILLGLSDQHLILDSVANLTWHHIRLGFNLTASTIDVWVDGAQTVTGGAVHAAASTIGNITVGQWSDFCSQFTTSETYLDNLVCTSVLDIGVGVRILSPRFFPTWQARNVFYPCVIYDDATGKYTMYYTGSGESQYNDSAWDQWITGYVTSTDTLSWAFPENYEAILYAHKFAEGDVVDPEAEAAIFDSIFAYGTCVIKDGSVFKMWYTGWNGESEHVGGGVTRKFNFRIGYATSPDGLNWTKHPGSAGAGAVMGVGGAGQLDSKGVGQPYVLKEGATYRMWYEGYDGTKWRIFYATSDDGLTWTKHGVALNTGAAWDANGLRDPVVITRNGLYELWYQGECTQTTNFRVLRAYSTDGVVWTKFSGQVALHPDAYQTGNERIHVDSIIVRPDQSCQVFYAKETAATDNLRYGSVRKKYYYIYTEVVNP